MIFQSLQFRCTSRLACSDLMTNEPPSSPKLSPHPLCFCSRWNTVQDLLQIVCFILVDRAPFCMARINLLPRQEHWRGKKNTQLLNRKVTGKEIVRVHWALLLWNICAVLQYCADNQKEMTLPEWWERIYKIFLYLSDSGCCISTTDTSLGISLSDHNIKVKNRSEKCLF